MEEEAPPPVAEGVGPLDLALALIAALSVSGIGFYVVRFINEPVSRALRVSLWCLSGGLGLYLGYVLRSPGAAWLREQGGVWASGWVTLFGSIVPLVIAWVAVRRKRSTSG